MVCLGESNSLVSNIIDRPDELHDKYVGKDILELDLDREPFELQCAFYDLVGQARGVPIHRLLGSQARDKVELVFWSAPMPVDALVSEAKRAYAEGFRTFKLKARIDTVN